VHINWWTLALQAINVLVLIWLLSRFLYRPLVAAIAARQGRAEKLLADAETAKEQAFAEAEAFKARNQALTADSERLRSEARTSAEADRARLLEEARQDASRVGDDARAGIASDRAVMQKELEVRAALLAGEMAGKLVARLPPAVVQDSMARSLVDRVAAMPDVERATLLTGGPLTVLSPAPFQNGGQEQVRDALTQVLGARSEILFDEDSALIGGCELHGAHIHIRNSWRADLDDMLENLSRESGDDRHS
jgi:F-type H+-transporting ATPase subunit b